MKSALLSILARYAYAEGGPPGSGSLALDHTLAAAHPVTVYMNVTSTADDLLNVNAWDVTTHDLTLDIPLTSSTYKLSGDFAKNYVEDINLLMGDTYDTTAITATVEVLVIVGETELSTTQQNIVCVEDDTGFIGSITGGDCTAEVLPLFVQQTTFNQVVCQGTHDFDPSDPTLRNRITNSTDGVTVGLTADSSTSGVDVATMTGYWTDTSTGYQDACAFTLEYGLAMRVIVRAFENGVQIGSDLQRSIPMDVRYSFGGYEMKPYYAGVAAFVQESVTAITVVASTGTEAMTAEVEAVLLEDTRNIVCDSTLERMSNTRVLNSVWVYKLSVGNCLVDGTEGATVADALLKIEPWAHNGDGLVSPACLENLSNGPYRSPSTAGAAEDCDLQHSVGSYDDPCAELNGTYDACIAWHTNAGTNAYWVAETDFAGTSVHTKAAEGKLHIALARYDEDVIDDGTDNSFALWFYVRLADHDGEEGTKFLGEQNVMTMSLALDASKDFSTV